MKTKKSEGFYDKDESFCNSPYMKRFRRKIKEGLFITIGYTLFFGLFISALCIERPEWRIAVLVFLVVVLMAAEVMLILADVFEISSYKRMENNVKDCLTVKPTKVIEDIVYSGRLSSVYSIGFLFTGSDGKIRMEKTKPLYKKKEVKKITESFYGKNLRVWYFPKEKRYRIILPDW